MNEETGIVLQPFVRDLLHTSEEYISVLNKQNAAALKSGFVTLAPGASVGVHNTGTREELIVVLEGQGTVKTGQNGEAELKAGQVAYNPPDTEHDVTNTGTSPLRYVYVVTNYEK